MPRHIRPVRQLRVSALDAPVGQGPVCDLIKPEGGQLVPRLTRDALAAGRVRVRVRFRVRSAICIST